MSSSWAIARGRVADVLAGFADNAFDACLCDPPYGFRFMNKGWDYDVPSVATWQAIRRVLAPGAPLVSFGGARTYHRLACGVEDAGFEMRDQLMWLYGKGFPKSQNISLALDRAAGAERQIVGQRKVTGTARIKGGGGYTVEATEGKYETAEVRDTIPITAPATALAAAWDGWGTALKPAFEPLALARKPLEGTMAANVVQWGVGGLAIDACRIGEAGGTTKGNPPKGPSNGVYGDGLNGACDVVALDAGRWPANLILDEDAAAILDASAGDRPSKPFPEHTAPGAVLPLTRRTAGGYSDSGGPSRFFYCAKVSTKEREAGCEHLLARTAGEMTEREDGSIGLENPRAGAGRTGGAHNHHPTLKPIALTTWLARLLLPPPRADRPRVILVPFSGAGSEMVGALRAGWDGVFGIELDEDGDGQPAGYIEIAQARLRHWCPESLGV